jgi:hypothetical protein
VSVVEAVRVCRRSPNIEVTCRLVQAVKVLDEAIRVLVEAVSMVACETVKVHKEALRMAVTAETVSVQMP